MNSKERFLATIERWPVAGLFPAGLILSPSHEALWPDVPAKNVAALFDEVSRP